LEQEQEITKNGQTYTVVNYIYNINNVQANHTISVICMSTSNTYIKLDDRYVRVEHIWKKVSGSWVEQENNLIDVLTAAGNIVVYNT
jgi:hypothetical protein